MKICKQKDRSYAFSYCEMVDNDNDNDDDDITSFNEIMLKPGQVKMIQVCCEFSLPALSGLHAIYNPSLIG